MQINPNAKPIGYASLKSITVKDFHSTKRPFLLCKQITPDFYSRDPFRTRAHKNLLAENGTLGQWMNF